MFKMTYHSNNLQFSIRKYKLVRRSTVSKQSRIFFLILDKFNSFTASTFTTCLFEKHRVPGQVKMKNKTERISDKRRYCKV